MSNALFNRDYAVDSFEVLAQIMDRGSPDEWRALYVRAVDSPEVRERMRQVVETVPLPFPYYWIAALRTLGESITYSTTLPKYDPAGEI